TGTVLPEPALCPAGSVTPAPVGRGTSASETDSPAATPVAPPATGVAVPTPTAAAAAVVTVDVVVVVVVVGGIVVVPLGLVWKSGLVLGSVDVTPGPVAPEEGNGSVAETPCVPPDVGTGVLRLGAPGHGGKLDVPAVGPTMGALPTAVLAAEDVVDELV